MSINCAARLSPISVGNNIRIVLLYRSVHCFQIDRAELIVQGAVQRVCSIGGNIQIVCTGRQRVTICAVKRQLTASRNVHRGTYQFAGRKILVDFYSHSAFGGIDDVNLPVTIAGIDRPRYDLIGRIGVELNRGARSYCAAYILWGGNRSQCSAGLHICCTCAPHQRGCGHASCERYAHHFLKLVHVITSTFKLYSLWLLRNGSNRKILLL